MRISKFLLIFTFLFFLAVPALAQTKNILSPEEDLWLKSRNSTIVVYPEKNNPPFSYVSAGGNIQGLAIDYIELIAEKVGAKITYLLPQSRSQILDEFTKGKGDVMVGLMDTNNPKSDFIFTDSFVTVPTVLVVRKDFKEKSSPLSLNDFNGKRVSVVGSSDLEAYIHQNYPRVVIEDVTDDEVSLQQIVLGEVDSGAMDIASLSYYLSRQVLSSVKVAGNTGLDYKPTFALLKDKAILQSILEKGMTQISTSDRGLLTDKWITVSGGEQEDNSFLSVFKDGSLVPLYGLLILILFALVFSLLRHRRFGMRYFQKLDTASELKKELNELKGADDILAEEIKTIKAQESKIEEKIESLEK
ncbi:MAG TPA: transporter substrate-binding domain-containing protein [Candidatus Paceibacterota bacterium]|jgi:ABC-type amino acid transport substrate-binding protein|nr:transporter substrate-binding domain-containing protein [Candidatus Paceibacterota bacterium]